MNQSAGGGAVKLSQNLNNLDSDEKMNSINSIRFSMPIVETVNMQRDLDIVLRWLEDCVPFVIVGSEGFGKNTLMKHAFGKLTQKIEKNINLATVQCNKETKSKHIIRKLYQLCSKFNSNNGQILRPNGCDKLIIYLKGINYHNLIFMIHHKLFNCCNN